MAEDLKLTCGSRRCRHKFTLSIVAHDYNVAMREGTYDHVCPECGTRGPCKVR